MVSPEQNPAPRAPRETNIQRLMREAKERRSAPPAVPAELKQEEQARVEITVVSEAEDQQTVKLTINGKDTGMTWSQFKKDGIPEEGEFFLEDVADVQGTLEIPEGIYFTIYAGETTAFITGGGDVKIEIDDLRAFKDNEFMILLKTDASEDIKGPRNLHKKTPGGVVVFNSSSKEEIRGLSVEEAIAHLKEEIPASDAAQPSAVPPNVAPIKVLQTQTAVSAETAVPAELKQEEQARVEITVVSEVEDQQTVKLTINGKDTGTTWGQFKKDGIPEEGEFFLEDVADAQGDLEIPKGVRLKISPIEFYENMLTVNGGENAKISTADLRYFANNLCGINLITVASNRWEVNNFQYEKGLGKARFYGGKLPIESSSVGDAINGLKEFLEQKKSKAGRRNGRVL